MFAYFLHLQLLCPQAIHPLAGDSASTIVPISPLCVLIQGDYRLHVED